MFLENFRKQIDSIDDQILELLVKRIQISKQVGEYKKQEGLQIRDFEREDQLVKSIEERADKLGMDQSYINALFKLILENSRGNQK
jgi:chorismate mutase